MGYAKPRGSQVGWGGSMQVMGPTSATKRTGVDGVKVLAKGAATHAVALNGAHDDRLGQHHGHNALGVHEGRVAEVVQAVVAEDGGTSLEPGGALACRAEAAGSEEGIKGRGVGLQCLGYPNPKHWKRHGNASS